jgi:hypothetical protein
MNPPQVRGSYAIRTAVTVVSLWPQLLGNPRAIHLQFAGTELARRALNSGFERGPNFFA